LSFSDSLRVSRLLKPHSILLTMITKTLLKSTKTAKYILLLFLLIQPYSIQAASSQTLIFELVPSQVTVARQPTSDWLAHFSSKRDGADVMSNVSAVKWHLQAEQHPLIRGIFRIEVPSDQIDDWLARLEVTPGVKWVEPEPVRYTCMFNGNGRDDPNAPPNDPYYPLQWSLHKIHAPAAWDISRGDTNVVIAIVDVGTDIDHGDLIRQRWINYAEANGLEGIDDDGNGFIDDIHGWDFVDDDPDPRPLSLDDDHGTHVAGIAAATVDNGYGIAGVCWNCRIMAIRTGNGGIITHGYQGVVYAAASGADVINLSWGGSLPSNIDRLTINYATEQGSLVIAAAGNRKNEHESNFDHFPSQYNNAMSIGATTSGDHLAFYSNYGEWVDICAPGDTILSTMPGNFGIRSGTSMATPIVAGAAGLLKALHPDWTPAQLRLQLINSADPIDHINPDYAGMMGVGRLNLFRMLSDVRSGFELTSIEIDDSSEGNGNGIIEAYENILVTVSIINLLTGSATATGRLLSDDTVARIDPFAFDFEEASPLETVDNAGEPFRVRVVSNPASGHIIDCRLVLNGLNVVEQSIPIELVVKPRCADHNNGSVSLTVTDFGALGYWDYIYGKDVGNSFRYAGNSQPALFHGSLMVGVPPDRVVDCAYGDSLTPRFDFISSGRGITLQEGATGGLEGHVEFRERDGDEDILDITVRQNSYSFPDPPDDDYVILSYTVINRDTDVDSLYVGIFMDWDILQPESNICQWDEEAGVGWMEYFRPGLPLYGVGILDNPVSFQVATNADDVSRGRRGWHDRTKIIKMMSGFNEAVSDEADDWTQLIGAGPFSLVHNQSKTVTFAILAGDNQSDLFANITAARMRWNEDITSFHTDNTPTEFKLINVYPSPFNSQVNIVCNAGLSGRVAWTMYDPCGRLIPNSGEMIVGSGQFILPVNGVNLPSGIYLVKLNQGMRSLTIPVVLVR